MAKWLLGLWLVLLLYNGHEANAYHSGGYRTTGSDQSEQVGLSAGHSTHGNIQEQPIYERPSGGGGAGGACPPQFSGVVAYPYDCHRYVNCHHGSPTIQTCAPGTLFNAQTLVCDHPSNVACAAPAAAQPNRSARLRELDAEPRCTPGVIGLQPHPTDCTKFLNCANGQAFVQDCGPGTAFSPSALICVHKSTVDCGAGATGQGYPQVSSEVPSCPPGLRGLHQHHHDPQKYLVCGIGVQARVETCPHGHIFDAHQLVCVFSASSAQSSSSAAFASAEHHLRDLLCPAGANGLFVHPFDQTRFLNCKDGKVAVQSCQPGFVFSISKGYCQLKSQLVFSDYVTLIISEVSFEYSLMLTACPGGLEGLHLYPYDAGKYVRCSANGQMSILECGPQLAFSLSQRECRPRHQVYIGDRVRFWQELEVQTTGYNYQETQSSALVSLLKACPLNLQGNYPYPFHAGHFVKCQNGQLQVECCPTGFVFSLSQRVCAARHLLPAHDYLDYDYLSVEFSTEFMQDFTAVTCPPQSRGYYLHPFDCSKYLKCLNQQTVVESCPQSQVFSISQQRCVAKNQLAANYDRVEYLREAQHELSEGRQSHGTNLNVNLDVASCPPGATGLQAHPYDCSKFLNCANGQTSVQSCGPGTAWSTASSTCDFAHKVDCSGRSAAQSGATYRSGSTQPSTTPATSVATIANDLLCPAGVDGLFVHPFDQTKFLNCKAGKVAVQGCQPGYVFSISKGQCQLKSQLVYSDYVTYIVSEISYEYSMILSACPGGTDGLHLYPYDAGKYVRCSAGKMSIVECGPQLAFSLSQKACRPRRQVTAGDRVKFWEELQVQTTYSYQDSQTLQSPLRSCPRSLQGNFPYPFHAGHFVKCQNGLLQVESCPPGFVFSLSQRVCAARHLLSVHDYLDYVYSADRLLPPAVADFMQDLTMITCPPRSQGYYLHPFDCTKYVICWDQQAAIESCKKGEVFSISQQLCVARDKVTAAYDRVEYLSETQHELSEEAEVEMPNGPGRGYPLPLDGGYQPQPSGVPLNGGYQPRPSGQPLDGRYQPQPSGVPLNGGYQPRPSGYQPQPTAPALDEAYGQSQGRGFSEVGAAYRPASAALTCPPQATGLFPNPFDAMGYLHCMEGHTLTRRCFSSDIFSISRGFCVPHEQVASWDRIPYNQQRSVEQAGFVRCPVGASGYFVYPFDCTKFLSCGPNGMVLTSCPAEQHFSVFHGLCQPKEQVKREDRLYTNTELSIIYEWTQQMKAEGAIPVCPVGISGSLPHPRIASKFFRCQPGQAEIYDCPSGQIFSISRRLCEPDAEVPSHDRCDYIVRGDGERETSSSSYGWRDQPNDNRQSKSYTTAGQDPWGNHYVARTTTTTRVVGDGDRWRDMNMQRPAGIGFQHSPQYHANQAQGWSGQGSSYDHRSPTQSVLYVEGSLQPNRNYPTSKTPLAPSTPLAPMAPNTPGQVVYAVPVEEEPAPAPIPSRHNYSPRVENSRWQPIPPKQTPNQSMPPLAPLGGQQPLDLDYTPDDRPTYNPYQPSGRELHSRAHLAGQQPIDLDYDPQEPQAYPRAPSRGLLPPKQDNDQLPSESHQIDTRFNPSAPRQPPKPTPSSPLPAAPSDESNLYGGLLPPNPSPLTTTTKKPSTLHVFPIYPRIANASVPLTSRGSGSQPHYSPSYAGIAHSRNASWAKGSSATTSTTTARPDDSSIEEDNDYEEELDYEANDRPRPYWLPETTTTARSGYAPPPFNHKFYSPSEQAPTTPQSVSQRATTPDPVSQLAISEALKLMLRPYFNHSGNAQERQAKQAELALVSVISKPPTSTSTTTTTTTTTPNPVRLATTTANPDDDAELIKAGEQESLDLTDDSDSDFADAGETAHTEQTLDPTTYRSQTDYQRSTRRAAIETTTVNWHASGHSRDFHRRHPNPNLLKPHSLHQKHNHNHLPPHSPHQHRHHEHSPDFHRRHPEMPNPFANKDKPAEWEAPEDPQQPQEENSWELLSNPNAESATPKIGVRSSFSDSCEFDCQNGNCVTLDSVCDGFNNCGNRKDESNCQHLGYEVRLTGGEKPHMGRISVKVNGKWGYVCDDKFGLRDADVVCRELGYKLGAQEVRGSSFYAPEDQNFNYAMDEVECHGNETMLKDCDFKGWGVHNCGVDEVAGVACKVPMMKCPNNYWLCQTSKECIPPAFVCDHTADCADKSDESAAICQAPVEFRLEGGRSSNEGRLEVKYHGVWGSVCDDDFNLKAAQVACNSLGYYGPAKLENKIFGHGNGPIWLDQVMCLGNEISIDKCSHWNWGDHNCNHTEDVALHCSAGPPPRSASRLKALKQAGVEKSAALTYSDIGLWERSSRAMRSPRRCGIFKDDLSDEYAHSGERVIKGKTARRGRHPWQATIRTRGRGGISSHWCGAVVISKRHLLTAAHCLYGNAKDAYFVRVGDHYANIAESSEVDTFIEKWYTHEKFRDGTHMNNDIAVVVLKRPLKFSDYVQPICLPDKNAVLQANRNCTISGWGSIKSGVSTPAQVLRSAELPILPDATCKQSKVYGSAMSEGMFCAGSMDESVDACEGDSGGPLVCSDDDGETLYGLISWGQHCGYMNRPGVYVRVNHYIDWIYEKINESLLRF
ncbi:blast:Scavenger receptor cysteine-rich domain-containing group B protein [Drosophila guanche]|uniref:Blast:Scavenger receptor cysteine-rich domain-containing group B protein n=1 Tax=Drosophila guanche TaxID=7266 RepID=A0A3B0JY79_DROGU|nr:blast:Scavenger receptor cysteine-rich domain-containing group B protein [Drosophila guanche]